jgi:hypothetical protein
MSETQKQPDTAVYQMRVVRDRFNQEIEAKSSSGLLDHVHGHRYESPLLQRLAAKAVSKAEVTGSVRGGH